MAIEFARKAKFKRNINLTPLIDIIFLLVVFFLLTSKFVTSESIDLSVSTIKEGGQSLKSQEALVIILKAGGNFSLDDKLYQIEELPFFIKGAVKNNKNTNIALVSSNGVSVQELVDAMDAIKSAGGNNISVSGSD